MNNAVKYTLYGTGAALVLFAGVKYHGYLLRGMIDSHNLEVISKLHPKYRPKYMAFIADLKLAGMTPYLTSGYRTYSKQQELYNQDHRNAKPGYSLHNFAIPVDINIMAPEFIGMNQSDEKWEKVVKIAKLHGLQWGGEIFGTYKDRVHFQPAHLPAITELRKDVSEGRVNKQGYVKLPII